MLTLTSSIKEINKVGIATARQLKNINIEIVEDLLHYYPFRYDDFSAVANINSLKAGINANIVGHIELIQNKRSPRKRIKHCLKTVQVLGIVQNQMLKQIR